MPWRLIGFFCITYLTLRIALNNMKKVFSIWKDTSFLAGRPREDFLAYNAQQGAFVVADGVGLWEGIEYMGKYPRSSGSGRLSLAFCEAFTHHFTRHPHAKVADGFMAGNAAAKEVNRDRSKYNVFRKHRGLFAATAAMARVDGQTLHWAHICDAGVMVIGANGKVKLHKDGCRHHFPWPNDVRGYELSMWTLFVRTLVRNAISKENELLGYGVITGEPEVERYVESGTYRLSPNDIVVLHTDGFAPYLALPEFRKRIIQLESQSELRGVVEDFIEKKTASLRKALQGHRVDGRASVEVIEGKLREILGKRFREVEWAKEKSLIIVKI